MLAYGEPHVPISVARVWARERGLDVEAARTELTVMLREAHVKQRLDDGSLVVRLRRRDAAVDATVRLTVLENRVVTTDIECRRLNRGRPGRPSREKSSRP